MPRKDISMTTAWRTVRVFISSTFRDMHAERDYLLKEVFPSLKMELEKKQIHLIDIDLRWGITEDQSRQGHIMDICLEEVDRCRPFFICILGQRYGWVPQGKERSITAMEIEHAIFEIEEKDIPHAFFYFRDGSFIDELQYPEQKQVYLDLLENGSQISQNLKKLDILKKKIENSPHQVFHYRAEWDERLTTPENYDPARSPEWNRKMTQGRLTGFQELGERVKADLSRAIAMVYPNEPKTVSALEEERSMHLAFAEQRGKICIGREEQKVRLSLHVRDQNRFPSVILGASGSGKSSFLASWCREYATANPDDCVIAHFIGASPLSAKVDNVLWRLCYELKEALELPDEIPTGSKERAVTLENFLFQSATKRTATHVQPKRVVIIIDALNQLEEQDKAHLLNWLPQSWPDNVSLVLSTLQGTCLDSLRLRKITEIPLLPLSEKDKDVIVTTVLGDYRKELTTAQRRAFLDNPATNSPLFLRVAIEELRLFGSYEQLSQRIGSLPDNVVDLFAQVLARLEKEQGENMVRDILCLLACSRHGLAEYEIITLLRDDQNHPLPRVYWAKLYHSLRPYLVKKGNLYTFFHDHLQQAVTTRYLAHDTVLPYHEKLAALFASSPDERKVAQLPYHLLKVGKLEELASILSDLDFFVSMTSEHDFVDVVEYWAAIGNKMSAKELYHQALALREQEQGSTPKTAMIYYRVGEFFREMGYYDAALSCFEKALTISVEKLGSDHQDVAMIYHDLAQTYKAQGNYNTAIEFLEKALAIRLDKLGQAHPDVAETYNGLAGVYYQQGEYTRALDRYKQALNIRQEKLGSGHQKVADTYNNIAQVYKELGEYEKALEIYEQALKIRLEKLGKGHPDVAATYNNIAEIYKILGRYTEAIDLYQMVLDIRAQKLGTEHPLIAITYNNFGEIYKISRDYEKAKTYYEKAQAIFIDKLGERHPNVATTYNNLALLYEDEGKYDQALNLYERALSIRLEKLGADHPQVATLYSNIAGIYFEQENYDKAVEFYQRALAINEAKLGCSHPYLAKIYNNIAGTYIVQHNYKSALEYYEKALQIKKEKLGVDHPEVATIYSNMGGVYYRQGNYENACELYRQALEIVENKFGTEHPDVSSARENLDRATKAAREGVKDDQKLRIQRLSFYKDDISAINKLLEIYLKKSQAKCTILIDKDGHLIVVSGNPQSYDIEFLPVTIAEIFAMSNQMAKCLGEDKFFELFLRGGKESIHIGMAESGLLLVAIFDTGADLGQVRLMSGETLKRLSGLLADKPDQEEFSDIIGEAFTDDAKGMLDQLFL